MRILGIDLGSSSIKAVEMDSAFGRYDVHDHHQYPVLPGTSSEDVITHLIKSLSKAPEKIIISLPACQTTFRNLQFPTKDKKAIQSGVGFELEDELPFSADQVIYDYALLSQSKQNTSVHVVATLKSHVTENLSRWKQAQLEPDIITSEDWAYRALLNRTLSSETQKTPVLLVQIGHQKTIFYLHHKNNPVLLREFPWGGNNISIAISQKYEISLEQAEAQKIDHGFVYTSSSSPNLTKEQAQLFLCIEKSFQPLLSELKQIKLIARTLTQQNVGLIYLSGGTSLLQGIHPWIEEKLQTPTKALLALSATTTSGVTYSEETDAHFLLATSLTLAYLGQDRTNCINFRKGEFSKQARKREVDLKALRRPLISVATIAFCLFLSLFVQSNVYRSRLAATDKKLESSIRSFFGQISTSAMKNFLTNTTTLRNSVNKELNKQREISKLYGENQHSPLNFLNSLSSSIPRDIVVDLTQFHAGTSPSEPYSSSEPSSAMLSFLVLNPQSAEKLASLLGTKLNSLQRGKMEEVSTEEGLKKWKITFSGKPVEDSNGK